VLSKTNIAELIQLRIESVVLRDADEIALNQKTSEPISEEFRELAVNTVQTVYDDFHNFDRRHVDQIRSISDQLVEEVQGATKLGIAVHDLRSYSDYTYRHCVNVTAISTAIGIRMGLGRAELNYLTIGGLLHDIGKMKISNDILEKDGPLTPEEIKLMRMHPEWSWELLEDRTDFSPIIWGIARQHHETMDGRGYPDGLRGDKIHELSRIVSIVDIWDALRSERPYKQAWNPDKVLAFLQGPTMVTKYDTQVLEIFSALVVPYPIGSRVMITGGRTAIVSGMNLGDYSRPIIKLENEADGEFMDLTEHKGLQIIETLALGRELETESVVEEQ